MPPSSRLSENSQAQEKNFAGHSHSKLGKHVSGDSQVFMSSHESMKSFLETSEKADTSEQVQGQKREHHKPEKIATLEIIQEESVGGASASRSGCGRSAGSANANAYSNPELSSGGRRPGVGIHSSSQAGSANDSNSGKSKGIPTYSKPDSVPAPSPVHPAQ